MATRGIQRRSFGNIWDNSKTSSSSSSSKKNLDATKDIAFYREKAERAAQRVARNHPTYGKGREVAPNDAALKSRADRTHGMGRRGKYFVNKKGRAYGQAKKGGGGGSFTWGAPGDEMLSVNTDAGDPNYNSEEENDDILFTDEFGREHLSASEPWASPSRNGYTGPPRMSSRIPRPHQSLKDFKKNIIDILSEYFVSDDIDEVEYRLLALNAPLFHWEFVKRSITMSMDHKERTREAVCRLLSALYGRRVLTSNHIGKGFERLFEYIDDLEMDVPQAKQFLAQFLARAVVDEILPPSFLMDTTVEVYGGEIVEKAKMLLSRKHGVARLERVWGPGDGRPVKELKKEIKMILEEYLHSGVKAEAARCVRALNASHFHHEVVKRAVVVAMDKSVAQRASMSALLLYMAAEGIISLSQCQQGFNRLYEALNDLLLDTPNAAAILEEFVHAAVDGGMLPPDYDGQKASTAKIQNGELHN